MSHDHVVRKSSVCVPGKNTSCQHFKRHGKMFTKALQTFMPFNPARFTVLSTYLISDPTHKET